MKNLFISERVFSVPYGACVWRKRRRRHPLRLQPRPPASAPWGQQVDITGTVKAFTLTPIGEIEGIILTNGTEIHVPPHLTEQVAAAVRPGEAVAVRGWNTGVPNFIVATALTGQRGQSVVDQGPPASRYEATSSASRTSGAGSANGHGARPDLAGPARPARGCEWSHSRRRDNPKITAAFGVADASLLQPGQSVVAQGWSLSNSYGRVVDVQSITSAQQAVPPLPERAPLCLRHRRTGRLGAAATTAPAAARLNLDILIAEGDRNALDRTQLPARDARHCRRLHRQSAWRNRRRASDRATSNIFTRLHAAAPGGRDRSAVKCGDTIRVRGVRPRLADIVAAMALIADDGEAIVDNGPGHEDEHGPASRRPTKNDGSRRRRAAVALRTKGRPARRFARRRHDHSHRPEGSGVASQNCCAPARRSPFAARVWSLGTDEL